MLRARDAQVAVDEFFNCALLGTGWEMALHRLARAANARGGNLICSTPDRSVGGFASPDVATTQARYYESAHPPDSRFVRVRVGPGRGFRSDHEDFTSEELARDPYYQEFLRPEGLQWHATAWLASFGDRTIEISLKRGPKQRPFSLREIGILNRVLPDLRRAIQVGRGLLDAETRGMTCGLGSRSAAIFEIGQIGNVVRATEHSNESSLPITTFRGRIRARQPHIQNKLDELIGAALTGERSSTLSLGNHWEVTILPITGLARDLFNASKALVVLQGGPTRSDRVQAWSGLMSTYGLTSRETEVAARLAYGTRVAEISTQLSIGEGTVRNHIKSIYLKTGTRRLSELSVLLARLRP